MRIGLAPPSDSDSDEEVFIAQGGLAQACPHPPVTNDVDEQVASDPPEIQKKWGHDWSQSWSQQSWSSAQWTTSSWWHAWHGRGSKWERKRNLRAAAHQQRVAMAQLFGESLVKTGPHGPAASRQACAGCGGRNHFALSCDQLLCGGC